MKRFELTTVLAALVLIPASAFAQPRAVVIDPVFDAGAVSRGTKIDHRFEIRNEGSESVTVREVQPACGCTVAEFDRTIEPGRSGSIHAVVDTSDFRGPIAKSVTVFTSDPENAKFNLTIKADVRMQIESRPGYARMIVIQGEPREASRQYLWTPDGPELEIRSVESPYPFLRVSHREATAEERRAEGPDRQLMVELELAESAPVGPIAGSVILRTNNPRQPELKIPVSGFVRPVVTVKPRAASFGSVALSEPYVATLEVQNLGSGRISVLGASTDVSGVSAGVEEVEAGKRYRVVVTLEPGMASGPFDGTLQIETSSKLIPLLEVELSGTVL